MVLILPSNIFSSWNGDNFRCRRRRHWKGRWTWCLVQGRAGHVENASGGKGRLVGGNTGEKATKESWEVGGSVEGAQRAPRRRRRGKMQRVEEVSGGGI